ncbi:hypothetical protein PanWU01x14_119560 [Parasponia andersonii]|uniref:Uncharacterized protein n=1 Tax=Parasponia andersonii TaxID=3476 RepID=A0A2P5CVG3_PARAD|nr:hypothetical protein PanWU01x14_119560 [Parasponia andersonii]
MPPTLTSLLRTARRAQTRILLLLTQSMPHSEEKKAKLELEEEVNTLRSLLEVAWSTMSDEGLKNLKLAVVTQHKDLDFSFLDEQSPATLNVQESTALMPLWLLTKAKSRQLHSLIRTLRHLQQVEVTPARVILEVMAIVSFFLFGVRKVGPLF